MFMTQLQNISAYNIIRSEYHSSMQLSSAAEMLFMSVVIERFVLKHNFRGYYYGAFQHINNLKKQLKLYNPIQKAMHQTYVFAQEVDLQSEWLAPFTFIPLKTEDRLMREWFIIYYGVEVAVALVAHERLRLMGTKQRHYDCVLTFDIHAIEKILYQLHQKIESPRPSLQISIDNHFRLMDELLESYLTHNFSPPTTPLRKS